MFYNCPGKEEIDIDLIKVETRVKYYKMRIQTIIHLKRNFLL